MAIANKAKYDEEAEHRAGQEQRDTEWEEDMHVLLLVGIQSRGHERPEMIENHRARQYKPDDQRRLEPDHEGFGGIKRYYGYPRILARLTPHKKRN